MNKIVIFAALILIVSLVGCAQQQPAQKTLNESQQTQKQPVQQQGQVAVGIEKTAEAVSIRGFAFNPANLAINAGTTVKWTNEDSAPHSIKSENFKSGTLSSGDSYEFRFVTPGIYDYNCGIHPSMKGQIIVK